MEIRKKSLAVLSNAGKNLYVSNCFTECVRYAAGNRIGIHKFKSDRGGSIAG